MSSLKENIGKSFQTITEMLMDRKGFLNEDETNILKSFSSKEIGLFAQKLVFNIDIGTKVRIIYFMQQPFRIPDFKIFVEKGEFDMYIVVYKKLTTNNMKTIHDFEKKLEKPVNMQLFEIRELLFNLTKHVLVPKHEVIDNEEEIENLVKHHNIKNRHHFPLILKTDPVAKYYGIKPGSLVKITRVSPSAGEYVVYRCCV